MVTIFVALLIGENDMKDRKKTDIKIECEIMQRVIVNDTAIRDHMKNLIKIR